MKKILLITVLGITFFSCQNTCPSDNVDDLAKCMCESAKEYSEAMASGDTGKMDELDRKMEIVDEEVAIEIEKGTYTSSEMMDAFSNTDCD